MKYPNWLIPSLRLKRWPYLISGLLLFAIKYNLDRAIVFARINDAWYFTDYFDYTKLRSITNSHGNGVLISLAITALPFIAIGTILTLRRLLDTLLPRWIVCLFFLPYFNILFFAWLSMIPSSTQVKLDETHRRPWLDRIIPQNPTRTAFAAALVSASLSAFAMWLSITVIGDYGTILFMAIPFMQGMCSTLFYGYRAERSLSACLRLSLLSVFFLGLFMFIAAIEGLICIMMAVPIAVPLALLGAFLGYFIQLRSKTSLPATILVLCFLPLAGWVEKQGHHQAPLVPVTTSVIIHKSKQEVWNQLVTFNNMRQPTELLFRAGIAYPVRAIIEGHGVGSVRRCQFSTGDFVEPITAWNEPNLLQFSVKKMPPPLVEWSLYDDLKLPHLENYFVSEKGQFKLTAINDNQTLLEGTTWYRHKIWPRAYWGLWSDYILHEIHLRVLYHIKDEAEGKR